MPLIEVDLLAGRTADQKRALVKELTDATVRTLATTPENVTIHLNERTADAGGVGGVLFSERT